MGVVIERERIVRAVRDRLATSLALAAIQFASVVILARLYAPSDFGQFALVSFAVGLSSVLAELGAANWLIQTTTHSEASEESALGLGLVAAVGLVSLVGILNRPIAGMLGDEQVAGLLLLAMPMVLIELPGRVARGRLKRRLQLGPLVFIDTAAALMNLGLAVVLALVYGWGATGLVVAALGAALVRTFAMAMAARTLLRRPRFDRALAQQQLYFGLPLTGAQGLNFAATSLDYVIAAHFLSSAAVGSYQRAYQLMAVPALHAGGLIDSVLYPTICRSLDSGDRQSVGWLRAIYGSVGTAGGLFGGAVMASAESLVLLLLGQEWLEARTPLAVLAVAFPLRVGYKISDAALRSIGETRSLLGQNAIFLALMIPAVSLGAWRFGLPGAAAGVATVLLARTGVGVLLVDRAFLLGPMFMGRLLGVTTVATFVGWLAATVGSSFATGTAGLAGAMAAPGLILIIGAWLVRRTWRRWGATWGLNVDGAEAANMGLGG